MIFPLCDNIYLTVLTCFFAPQCHFSIPINQTQKMFRNTFSHSFLRDAPLANLPSIKFLSYFLCRKYKSNSCDDLDAYEE